MSIINQILWAAACYIIGSIPFSYIMGRQFGKLDIRKHGSGNVGATNTLRTLGAKVAIPALVGDLLKGVVAAWIGSYFGGPQLALWCSILVVIGHCYPIFLNFEGGKGVATSAGVILFLMPKVLLILLVTFVTVIAFSRYVSLGSVTAAVLAPVAAILLYRDIPSFIILMFLLAITVIYRHRTNIERLRNGTESRFEWKK